MSEITLKRIADSGAPLRLYAVFLHGLGGDPDTTWRHASDFFWPRELAHDLKGLTVYSIGYPCDKTRWGSGWPIAQSAVAVLDRLISDRELRASKTPIVFICHSLGGLIIKKLILTAQSDRGQEPEKGVFLDRIAGVVFLATPHGGSFMATIASQFHWFVSESMRDLKANDANLLDLSISYRNCIADDDARIRHRVYYETEAISGAKPANAMTSDPGITGVRPYPVGRDHMAICKVPGRADQVYVGVMAFLEDALKPRPPSQGQKIDQIYQNLRHILTVLSDGAQFARILAVDPVNETISAKLLSLVEELRRTHSTIVNAISPLRRISDKEATFADDFRAVYNSFRDFYDHEDFLEARTHCHKVEHILTRLENLDPAIVQRKEWQQLRSTLKMFVGIDLDFIDELIRPFMKRFNDVMVKINGLVGGTTVTSGQVIEAIALKQGFLNALGSEYDDIKRMLRQMTETIAEIENSLLR
jgi:pimeloyl-ACP methyl ester carboxylesterase